MIRYRARPLRDEADRANVQRLWRETTSDPRVQEAVQRRWRWLHERNPAGLPRVCVVTNSVDGEVIGTASALPRVLWIGEQRVLGAVLFDFAVDSGHRVAGAAVSLQRELARVCFESGFDVLFGFPNEAAHPVLARVGYQTVGMATMMSRPLRASVVLGRKRSAALGWAAAVSVDPLMALYDTHLRLVGVSSLRDSIRERAGQDFDELWQAGRPHHLIAGERTAAYLNWRYAEHPIEDCKFFCLADRQERLVGYITYNVSAGKVNVLDAFWRAPEDVEPLFQRFLWRMRTLKHAYVSVCHAGDPRVGRILCGLLFIESRQRRRLICHVAPPHAETLGRAVLEARHWSLFEGELDL